MQRFIRPLRWARCLVPLPYILLRTTLFDDQPGILDSHEYPRREQRHAGLPSFRCLLYYHLCCADLLCRIAIEPLANSRMMSDFYCLAPRLSIAALLSEHLMHERNRDRAFSHCRRYTFDVAAAHITRRENPWEAGFKQVWPTSERPVRSA